MLHVISVPKGKWALADQPVEPEWTHGNVAVKIWGLRQEQELMVWLKHAFRKSTKYGLPLGKSYAGLFATTE